MRNYGIPFHSSTLQPPILYCRLFIPSVLIDTSRHICLLWWTGREKAGVRHQAVYGQGGQALASPQPQSSPPCLTFFLQLLSSQCIRRLRAQQEVGKWEKAYTKSTHRFSSIIWKLLISISKSQTLYWSLTWKLLCWGILHGFCKFLPGSLPNTVYFQTHTMSHARSGWQCNLEWL